MDNQKAKFIRNHGARAGGRRQSPLNEALARPVAIPIRRVVCARTGAGRRARLKRKSPLRRLARTPSRRTDEAERRSDPSRRALAFPAMAASLACWRRWRRAWGAAPSTADLAAFRQKCSPMSAATSVLHLS
jgi:hypothetical protein